MNNTLFPIQDVCNPKLQIHVRCTWPNTIIKTKVSQFLSLRCTYIIKPVIISSGVSSCCERLVICAKKEQKSGLKTKSWSQNKNLVDLRVNEVWATRHLKPNCRHATFVLVEVHLQLQTVKKQLPERKIGLSRDIFYQDAIYFDIKLPNNHYFV